MTNQRYAVCDRKIFKYDLLSWILDELQKATIFSSGRFAGTVRTGVLTSTRSDPGFQTCYPHKFKIGVATTINYLMIGVIILTKSRF